MSRTRFPGSVAIVLLLLVVGFAVACHNNGRPGVATGVLTVEDPCADPLSPEFPCDGSDDPDGDDDDDDTGGHGDDDDDTGGHGDDEDDQGGHGGNGGHGS
jgi:hypothetical protein